MFTQHLFSLIPTSIVDTLSIVPKTQDQKVVKCKLFLPLLVYELVLPITECTNTTFDRK